MARDFLKDKTGDLSILNGDLEIGFSDEEHVEDILIDYKGDYKQSPLMGLGIEGYLKSPVTLLTRQKFEKEIALQLESDQAKNIVANYGSNGEIELAANYE